MSDYVFLVGDDYQSNNKEYVSIDTDKGKLISIALAASGIPFKGRFNKERMLFNYDGIYNADSNVQHFTGRITLDLRKRHMGTPAAHG